MEFNLDHFEDDNLGSIKIAPNVIEVIAKLTALEVEGVAGLGGGVTSEIAEFLGRNKSSKKGVKVETGQKEAIVNVNIVLKYGYSVPNVAEQVQANIKDTIENMTGLSVVEVNVHISGVEFND